MAKWKVKVFFICTLTVAGFTFARSEQGIGWGLATSLAGVPVEISDYLIDHAGLADKGGQFNLSGFFSYDVPASRFVNAAVSANEVIVAMEQGGRAGGIKTLAFRQQAGHWVPMERGSIIAGAVPMTAKVIREEHAASTGRSQP